jgi:hypothetical protein
MEGAGNPEIALLTVGNANRPQMGDLRQKSLVSWIRSELIAGLIEAVALSGYRTDNGQPCLADVFEGDGRGRGGFRRGGRRRIHGEPTLRLPAARHSKRR